MHKARIVSFNRIACGSYKRKRGIGYKNTYLDCCASVLIDAYFVHVACSKTMYTPQDQCTWSKTIVLFTGKKYALTYS